MSIRPGRHDPLLAELAAELLRRSKRVEDPISYARDLFAKRITAGSREMEA